MEFVQYFPDGKMYFAPRENYGNAFIFKLLNSDKGKKFFDDLLKPLQKSDAVYSPDYVADLLDFVNGINRFMVYTFRLKFLNKLK